MGGAWALWTRGGSSCPRSLSWTCSQSGGSLAMSLWGRERGGVEGGKIRSLNITFKNYSKEGKIRRIKDRVGEGVISVGHPKLCSHGATPRHQLILGKASCPRHLASQTGQNVPSPPQVRTEEAGVTGAALVPMAPSRGRRSPTHRSGPTRGSPPVPRGLIPQACPSSRTSEPSPGASDRRARGDGSPEPADLLPFRGLAPPGGEWGACTGSLGVTRRLIKIRNSRPHPELQTQTCVLRKP